LASFWHGRQIFVLHLAQKPFVLRAMLARAGFRTQNTTRGPDRTNAALGATGAGPGRKVPYFSK